MASDSKAILLIYLQSQYITLFIYRERDIYIWSSDWFWVCFPVCCSIFLDRSLCLRTCFCPIRLALLPVVPVVDEVDVPRVSMGMVSTVRMNLRGRSLRSYPRWDLTVAHVGHRNRKPWSGTGGTVRRRRRRRRRRFRQRGGRRRWWKKRYGFFGGFGRR